MARNNKGKIIMLKIGCHLSSSKGFTHMLKEAISIEANTFQFFTRNPRGGKAKDIDLEDISIFLSKSKEISFNQILAHAPYTLNPASKDAKIREFAHMVMEDDLQRLEHLDNALYNFHPGSHVGAGIQEGINLITDLLNKILKPDLKTTVLLETMSGSGTEIGSTFEELKTIMDATHLKEKIGVCLDTCHIYSGGYDIKDNLDQVLEHFDKVIGLDKLKAIHLNDTKMPFNSHKDRHEKIGEGQIGLDALVRLINHPALKEKLFLLETPNELDGYQQEIALLKNAYQL